MRAVGREWEITYGRAESGKSLMGVRGRRWHLVGGRVTMGSLVTTACVMTADLAATRISVPDNSSKCNSLFPVFKLVLDVLCV
jgi:hypothetical protein